MPLASVAILVVLAVIALGFSLTSLIFNIRSRKIREQRAERQ